MDEDLKRAGSLLANICVQLAGTEDFSAVAGKTILDLGCGSMKSERRVIAKFPMKWSHGGPPIFVFSLPNMEHK